MASHGLQQGRHGLFTSVLGYVVLVLRGRCRTMSVENHSSSRDWKLQVLWEEKCGGWHASCRPVLYRLGGDGVSVAVTFVLYERLTFGMCSSEAGFRCPFREFLWEPEMFALLKSLKCPTPNSVKIVFLNSWFMELLNFNVSSFLSPASLTFRYSVPCVYYRVESRIWNCAVVVTLCSWNRWTGSPFLRSELPALTIAKNL